MSWTDVSHRTRDQEHWEVIQVVLTPGAMSTRCVPLLKGDATPEMELIAFGRPGGRRRVDSPLLKEGLSIDHILSNRTSFPSPITSRRINLIQTLSPMRIPSSNQQRNTIRSYTTISSASNMVSRIGRDVPRLSSFLQNTSYFLN